MKVEVCCKNQNEDVFLEINVLQKDANLQDLLDAWQPWCDDESLFRQYAPDNYAVCRGCQHNCCSTAYVIPDLISFKAMASYVGLDHARFIEHYFETDKREAGILRLKPNPCIFLQEQLCTIYHIRSLICRFYLCSELSGETEQLIYLLSWLGAAATQLFAEQEGLICSHKPGAGSSFDTLFANLIEEYRFDARVQLFLKADSYQDIPLRPFL